MLHKNSDQHARGVSSFIQVSTDTYNSLKKDLAEKRTFMGHLRKGTAAKTTIRGLDGENRKPVIQA